MTFKLLGIALVAAVLSVSQISPPNYEEQGRMVVLEMAARHFDKVVASFDENVAKILPTDKLAKSWDSLLIQAGDFQSIEKVRRGENRGLQIVYVTCVFQRSKWDIIAAFDPQGHIVQFTSVPTESLAPWTQPGYVRNEKFHEREVSVGTAPWQLPGTLTLPNGAGPFPAVVLVHGSGPNDRDEALGPNKMFKDLAWGLAGKGIAVLRYDKRTRVHSRQLMAQPGGYTVNDETVDDARAAVALLAAQPEIQAKRIFVLGHSLGGYVAPRIASGDSQIAGLIIMAGSTRPMEELLMEQVRYSVGLSGKPTTEGEELIAQAEKSAAEVRDPGLKPGMNVHFMGAVIPASYFLDLRTYHASEVASGLHVPMMVLQGDRDYQVQMADLNGWKKALDKKPAVTFKIYPGLNHFFMPGTGPSSGAEYLKPNHVQEDVVQDIEAWIAKH
jgi:dienelactone hydrolase